MATQTKPQPRKLKIKEYRQVTFLTVLLLILKACDLFPFSYWVVWSPVLISVGLMTVEIVWKIFKLELDTQDIDDVLKNLRNFPGTHDKGGQIVAGDVFKFDGHKWAYLGNSPVEEVASDVNAFCVTPGSKCTMNYCDENGCQDRKRNYTDPLNPTAPRPAIRVDLSHNA